MNKMLAFFARTPVLVGTFILMLAVVAGFVQAQGLLNSTLLDMDMSGPVAQQHLSELSADQRNIHFWTTLILDTLYPIAYGGFFGGLAVRFGGKRATLAALPMMLGVLCDFIENVTQMLALKGFDGLLVAKTVLTPLKFGLVYLGILIALALVLAALVRRLFRPRAA